MILMEKIGSLWFVVIFLLLVLTSLWAIVVVSFGFGCCGYYGGSGCFFVSASVTFSYHLG